MILLFPMLKKYLIYSLIIYYIQLFILLNSNTGGKSKILSMYLKRLFKKKLICKYYQRCN